MVGLALSSNSLLENPKACHSEPPQAARNLLFPWHFAKSRSLAALRMTAELSFLIGGTRVHRRMPNDGPWSDTAGILARTKLRFVVLDSVRAGCGVKGLR
jgi:hypothetical protein